MLIALVIGGLMLPGLFAEPTATTMSLLVATDTLQPSATLTPPPTATAAANATLSTPLLTAEPDRGCAFQPGGGFVDH
jgi:hypothetical protein